MWNQTVTRKKQQQTDAETQRVRLTDWTWRKYREAATDQLKQDRLGDLVQLYLPWVSRLAVRVSHHVSPATADHDDLVQVGSVGLVQSIERFNPDRGARFTTFARTRVMGAMRDYLRVVNHLSRSHQASVQRGDSPPVRLTSLDHARGFPPVSLAERLQGTSVSPSDRMEATEFWWQATRGCDATERLTVFGRHRDGLTMDTIGRYLGLSGSRISQLHTRAIQQMQQRHTREELAADLPGPG